MKEGESGRVEIVKRLCAECLESSGVWVFGTFVYRLTEVTCATIGIVPTVQSPARQPISIQSALLHKPYSMERSSQISVIHAHAKSKDVKLFFLPTLSRTVCKQEN